jgi:adenylosuccinate synthase
MKHSCLINGYDSLNLTKLDVLDGLAEIKIGAKYLVNGKELSGFPGGSSVIKENAICRPSLANLDVLSQVEVEYVTLSGWKTSIQEVKTFEGLPANCKAYIEFIEEFLGVEVEWIGTGPGRYNMIRRTL